VKTFKVGHHTYINVNGKDFYAVRFLHSFTRPVLLQAIGTSPLLKSDLPDESWDVMRTAAKPHPVYLAWIRSCFALDPMAKSIDGKMVIGPSTAGTRYLAHRILLDHLGLRLTAQNFAKAAVQDREYLTEVSDLGNLQVAGLQFHLSEDLGKYLKKEIGR